MKRVFVIEHDEITILILQKYIKRMGHSIVGTKWDSPSAIKSIKEERPDIVFTDINLPGEMDGIDIIEEVRKFSNVPIVFLTSHTLPHVKKRTEKLGNTEFLIKPFNYDELEQLVQALLYSSSIPR